MNEFWPYGGTADPLVLGTSVFGRLSANLSTATKNIFYLRPGGETANTWRLRRHGFTPCGFKSRSGHHISLHLPDGHPKGRLLCA
jgi:hypothetical protein